MYCVQQVFSKYSNHCCAPFLVLLCPGKGEAIETTLAALQVVPEPFRSFANTLVDICAYAGTRSSHTLCSPTGLSCPRSPSSPLLRPHPSPTLHPSSPLLRPLQALGTC